MLAFQKLQQMTNIFKIFTCYLIIFSITNTVLGQPNPTENKISTVYNSNQENRKLDSKMKDDD